MKNIWCENIVFLRSIWISSQRLYVLTNLFFRSKTSESSIKQITNNRSCKRGEVGRTYSSYISLVGTPANGYTKPVGCFMCVRRQRKMGILNSKRVGDERTYVPRDQLFRTSTKSRNGCVPAKRIRERTIVAVASRLSCKSLNISKRHNEKSWVRSLRRTLRFHYYL